MQSLLKKETPYIWDKNIQAEFDGVKQILKSSMGLKPFNKAWKTILFTDYSAKGVGFALTQENPEDKKQKQLIVGYSIIEMKKLMHQKEHIFKFLLLM